MAEYSVRHGQSIYDIATQKYGDIYGVENIFRDNPTIDFGTYLETGRKIIISEDLNDISNQSIRGYFSDKTITNTENEKNLVAILNNYSYGRILTINDGGSTYVNNSVRAIDGQIRLVNRVGGAEMSFDRVLFSESFSANADGDELEIILNYDSFTSGFNKWIPLGGSKNKSSNLVIFDTGRISLYDNFGNELIHSTVITLPNIDIAIKIRCEILQDGSSTKNYHLSVDGNEESALDVGSSEVEVDIIGGSSESGVDGYNGIIKYFGHNLSEYRFGENEGIYVHKSIV